MESEGRYSDVESQDVQDPVSWKGFYLALRFCLF